MIKQIFVILILYVFYMGAYAMDTKNEYELSNTISGEQAILISISFDELKSRNIEFEKYELSIFESPKSWLLLFKYSATPPGYRGSFPGFPSYEVEIDKKDNKVIRSNQIR